MNWALGAVVLVILLIIIAAVLAGKRAVHEFEQEHLG